MATCIALVIGSIGAGIHDALEDELTETLVPVLVNNSGAMA